MGDRSRPYLIPARLGNSVLGRDLTPLVIGGAVQGEQGGYCVHPYPLVDPTGFAREQERLRREYAEAYAGYFATHLPDNGVPARFTVHVVDVPDTAASYEFYGTALLQRSLQRNWQDHGG